MPTTITTTLGFDTDLQGFSGTPNGAWDSGGGGTAKITAPGNDEAYLLKTGFTWEDLGVPSGNEVTDLQISYDLKVANYTVCTSDGCTATDVTSVKAVLYHPSSGFTIYAKGYYSASAVGGDPGGAFVTVVLPSDLVRDAFGDPVPSPSNTALSLKIFGVLHYYGTTFTVAEGDIYFDGIALTITYQPTGGGGGPTPQTISPTTATLHPGETQVFTTNNAADFGITGNTGTNTGGSSTDGGGSGLVTNGGDGAGGTAEDTGTGLGVTYTAPNTPGTYTLNAVDRTDHTNTASAVITVVPTVEPPPRVLDMPALSRGFHGFLLGADGLRKNLPARSIRAAHWEDERYGGWTQFSLDLNVLLTDPIAAAQGDRVEFWFYGQRRYRGYVTGIELTEDDPPSVSLSGYGIAFRAAKPISNHAYVYAVPTDIARVFADVASEWVSPKLPALVIDAQSVGVSIQQVEATYKSIGETINDLTQNQGENLALWGGDADDDGNDRLFIKPFSSVTDYTIPVPGRNTTASKRESQSGDVVNRLTILGGTPRYPNLVYNSSFERPRFSGVGEGNLLDDPDFEAGGVWTGSGIYLTSSSIEGSAYTGSNVWETDHSGETGTQSQNPPSSPVVPGWDYLIRVQAKAESSAATAAGRVTLQWRNVSDTVIGTTTLDIPAVGSGGPSALTTYWQAFQTVSRAPALATGFTYTIEDVSGGTGGAGIHWDACELTPATVIYQDRWELDVKGSAAVNGLNWAYRDGIDGGYCVYADISASDADANEAAIQPLALERFEVQRGAIYTVSAFFKSPPGVTTNGKMRIEVQEFNKDGVETDIQHINIPAGSGWTDWTQQYQNVTLDATSTHALVRVVWRGNSAALVDGVCMRDSSAGLDYIRDGQFVAQISADDPALSGVSFAALSSIATYGTQDGQAEDGSITTIEDARVYASAYFNAHAVAFPLPTVDLVDDPRFFRPGQNVRLIGKDGVALMDGESFLPIVKASWAWDGMLKVSLELKKEIPDLADMLLRKLKRVLGSAGSSSYTSTSGGSAPVPITTPPGVTDIKATGELSGQIGEITLDPGTDITITRAGATFTFKVDDTARDSSLFGIFTSLDARLEFIEAALGGSSIVPPGFVWSLDFSIGWDGMYLPVVL